MTFSFSVVVVKDIFLLVPTDETVCLHLSVNQSDCRTSFPDFSLFSDIRMEVGSELAYEELQIKFDFRHG